MDDLSQYINPNVLNHVSYTGRSAVSVTVLSAQMFTSSRFDLMAKLIYAEGYCSNSLTDWDRHVYSEHIRAFNNFHENDGSGKIGRQKFIESFDAVLGADVSPEPSTLNVIPVNQYGTVIDGSHRLIRAYVRREPVHLVYFHTDKAVSYDYRFFRRRGIELVIADAMAFHFGVRNEKAHCLIFFPSVTGRRKYIEQLMRRYFDVFYCREVRWTDRARHNITSVLYQGEEWLGTFSDGFPGARRKYKHCFTSAHPLLFYMVQPHGSIQMNEAKVEIRRALESGQHSVHASTDGSEKLRMMQLFLNKNSVHWLNSALPKYPPNFGRLLESHGRCESGSAVSCLSGSSVYAAYGIRDVADLDCVYSTEGQPVSECHRQNEYLEPFFRAWGKRVTDMVHDPRLHFYYFGQKVVAMWVYNRFKRTRRERKDLRDGIRWIAFAVINEAQALWSRLRRPSS